MTVANYPRGRDAGGKPIGIGDSCWVGACAFVGPGAVLPPGTMVKAGATASQKPNAGG